MQSKSNYVPLKTAVSQALVKKVIFLKFSKIRSSRPKSFIFAQQRGFERFCLNAKFSFFADFYKNSAKTFAHGCYVAPLYLRYTHFLNYRSLRSEAGIAYPCISLCNINTSNMCFGDVRNRNVTMYLERPPQNKFWRKNSFSGTYFKSAENRSNIVYICKITLISSIFERFCILARFSSFADFHYNAIGCVQRD